MVDTLKQLIEHLFKRSEKQPIPLAEPADFIIERFSRYNPSWGNSRVVYRIRHWLPEDKRYSFEGEHFYIQNTYNKLKELGAADPTLVPLVDIESPRG
jgi:hypothetical protein